MTQNKTQIDKYTDKVIEVIIIRLYTVFTFYLHILQLHIIIEAIVVLKLRENHS